MYVYIHIISKYLKHNGHALPENYKYNFKKGYIASISENNPKE